MFAPMPLKMSSGGRAGIPGAHTDAQRLPVDFAQSDLQLSRLALRSARSLATEMLPAPISP